MSADVVNLTPKHDGAAREAFVSHVAMMFDGYVRDYGAEPDALVLVFGGLKQTARSGWLIRGASEGGTTTMTALAAAVLMKETVAPD
jgi:hypothetical protein